MSGLKTRETTPNGRKISLYPVYPFTSPGKGSGSTRDSEDISTMKSIDKVSQQEGRP